MNRSRSRQLALLLWIVMSLCAACATTTPPPAASPDEANTVSEPAAAEAPKRSPAQVVEAETGLLPPMPSALRREGEILRVELNAFLDQGPAFLLQQVPVEPVVSEGALVGFRIQSFFAQHPRLARADLRPGDVIVAVNAQRVVFPEDLFTVWSLLRTAPYLQIDLIRGQALLTRTWMIKDAASAAAASTPPRPTP